MFLGCHCLSLSEKGKGSEFLLNHLALRIRTAGMAVTPVTVTVTSSLLGSQLKVDPSILTPKIQFKCSSNYRHATRNGGFSCIRHRRKWVLRNNHRSVVETSAPSSSSSSSSSMDSASTVVRQFYHGINAHDLVSVETLIAENCVYEDLIFPQAFVGRKAILGFFNKFIDTISTDLQFVIDDISETDPSGVGVTWHLEWKGRPFPFSKGCSFYRLDVVDGKRQICYGRDSVEPAFKPGELALVAIRGVTWLFQRFPQLAEYL